MAGHTLHVISHSHWDREWYLPLELHRRRLVTLLDDLLEVFDRDPAFGSFHLDGQAIPLEDYLAIRPQQLARLQRAAQERRLTVGPWYVLQDEFLTSAEAQARNLLYGLRAAAEFAPPLMVGYLADSFGHIGQMPALLRGFGIDNAVFGRGLRKFDPQADPALPAGERGYHSELTWRGADGAEILGVLMTNWYSNAMDIPSEPAACVARFGAIRDAAARYATTPHLLLMNGCDHTPCQLNISELIATGRAGLDETIVHSRLDDYLAAVRDSLGELEVASGELRSEFTDGWGTLTDVLSARLYLKQANWRCQGELEHYLEPLQALGGLLGLAPDRDFRAYLWKLLLQNHPHDSICGCSIDPVHREMETRFEKVEQLAGQLASEGLQGLAARVDTSALADGASAVVVFNPLGFDREELVEAVLDWPEETALAALRVTNAAGEELPAELAEDQGRVWDYDLPADRFRVPYYRRRVVVRFQAAVPALGYATFTVTPLATAPAAAPATELVLENDWLRVTPGADLRLDVLDKRTGRQWPGLNQILAGADHGNEYNYRPPADDREVGVGQVTWRRGGTALAPSLQATGRIERDGRALQLDATVTLAAGSRRIDVRLELDNGLENFRLRACFPTDTSAETASADGHFEVVQRPIVPWHGWQNPSNCQPCQDFVDVSDQHGGLTIANRGLPEYEVLRDGRNTIALTLLRGTKELGDWGVFPTPDAQCPGRQIAEYAIIPHAGELRGSGADGAARAFNVPLRAQQTARHHGSLPASASWLRLEPAELALSAVRWAEDRDAFLVRFYNPYPTATTARLRLGRPAQAAWRCNLNEERGEALPLADGAVELPLGPKEIVTIELAWD